MGQDEILKTLRKNQNWMTIKELIEGTGLKKNCIQTSCRKLYETRFADRKVVDINPTTYAYKIIKK